MTKEKPQAKKRQKYSSRYNSQVQSASRQSGYSNNCFKNGKPGHKKVISPGKPCQAYIGYCKKNCNIAEYCKCNYPMNLVILQNNVQVKRKV